MHLNRSDSEALRFVTREKMELRKGLIDALLEVGKFDRRALEKLDDEILQQIVSALPGAQVGRQTKAEPGKEAAPDYVTMVRNQSKKRGG
ncbi:MAG: hypothetical protein WC807_21240 [Hyphomicrobium sp.]|jgi:hypothetical protein